jgi:Domain of unknown function (DUF4365)
MDRRSYGALQNPLQGDFGEQWLEAVAAGCDILHGRPTTLDLEKADVELTLMGEHGGSVNPTVKVQVKTMALSDLRKQDDGYSYDLDIKTYDVLRRTNHAVRRILAVIAVDEPGKRVRLHDEGTLLGGIGAWASLEGLPASANETSQVVKLPLGNTLDGPGLEKMLVTYGVRGTSIVPEFDPWGES